MDLIEALDRSWKDGARVVSALTPEQLAMACPSGEWDVRAALEHTLEGGRMFTRANLGADAAADGGEPIGADVAAAWSRIGNDNVDSWRSAGMVGERTYPFGTFPAEMAAVLNIGEILAHGWDIAKGTGQDSPVDAEVAALVYASYSKLPMDEFRKHGAFGPLIAVPDDASDADRLLGFLGRQP